MEILHFLVSFASVLKITDALKHENIICVHMSLSLIVAAKNGKCTQETF